MIFLNFTELAEIVSPVAQKYGIEKIILFGSAAKGTATDSSDYDFLISKGSLKSLIRYSSFVNELETLLQCHVDVITDTSADKYIIQTAMQEGVLLYER